MQDKCLIDTRSITIRIMSTSPVLYLQMVLLIMQSGPKCIDSVEMECLLFTEDLQLESGIQQEEIESVSSLTLTEAILMSLDLETSSCRSSCFTNLALVTWLSF